MKADQKTQAEVSQTIERMFEAYKLRDLDTVLSLWSPDPDVLVVGSGEDEWSMGLAEFAESVKRDWTQSQAASITFKVISASTSGLVCWFAAAVVFEFMINGGESNLPGRLTGVMEKRSGKWLLMQMHFSTPACIQEHGKSCPKAQVCE